MTPICIFLVAICLVSLVDGKVSKYPKNPVTRNIRFFLLRYQIIP